MTLHIVKKLLTAFWTSASLIFIIIFFWQKRELIGDLLGELNVFVLITAAFSILAAKLCLVVVMRQAASVSGIDLGWRDSFFVYNVTQLAKYVPGSVWHFVGRIALLRNRGASGAAIRDSLVAEQAWIVGSAALVATTAILISRPADLWLLISDNVWISGTSLLIGGGVLVSSFAVLAFKYGAELLAGFRRFLPSKAISAVLLLTWLLLGIAFFITVTSFVETPPPFMFIIGVFCLAWVLGFLVPFAPAGLGIREAVLAAGLMPFLSIEIAVMLAAVNRIIYLSVEVALVLANYLSDKMYPPGKGNQADYC